MSHSSSGYYDKEPGADKKEFEKYTIPHLQTLMASSRELRLDTCLVPLDVLRLLIHYAQGKL